jgi:predicted Zn-dependent peptidase
MLAASQILGGGLSSRLFTRVREEKGLVYQIQSHPVVYSDAGSVDVALRVDDANLFEACEATLEVLEEYREDGVTEDELESYKENVRCGMDIMCDRPDKLADYLGRQELLLPPAKVRSPAQFVAEQESLTREDLREVICDIFHPDNANLAVVGPFGDGQKERISGMFPAEECELG